MVEVIVVSLEVAFEPSRCWVFGNWRFFWIRWVITSRRLAVWEQKEVNCLKVSLELISAIVSSCNLVVIQ